MKTILKIVPALLFLGAIGCSAVESTGEGVSRVGQGVGEGLSGASHAVGSAGSSIANGVGDAVSGTGKAIEHGAQNTASRGY